MHPVFTVSFLDLSVSSLGQRFSILCILYRTKHAVNAFLIVVMPKGEDDEISTDQKY